MANLDDSWACDNGMDTERPRPVSLPSVEIKSGAYLCPAMASKGNGLKKWRRIKRDSDKVKDVGVDNSNITIHEVLNSCSNSCKRMQVVSDRIKKTDGSASSMDEMLRSFNGFQLLGDLEFARGSTHVAVTALENRSSKSSPPARAPKSMGEEPGFMRSPCNSGAKSLSGKCLAHPVQRDRQEKCRIGAFKKNSRADMINIEKENSHSSVESDFESSNFVFMQGIYSKNNGIENYKDNGDEVQGIDHRCSNEPQGCYRKDGDGGYEDFSPEHADSYAESKDERSQNHGSSTDVDSLVESISFLKSVKEALENELLKFKDISVDDLVQDIPPDISYREKTKETSSKLFHSAASPSEVLEAENKYLETDIEDCYKQKIEADVEYLTVSGGIRNLKVAAQYHITVLQEQKTLQTEFLHKLDDTEQKALKLNKEAEKLKTFCEDITVADKALKMQKKVCKLASFFFLQLLAFMLVLDTFMFQLSPKYVDVVPT